MSGPTWVWGRRAVIESLRAGTTNRIFIHRGVEQSFRQIVEMEAVPLGISIEVVERTEIDAIAHGGKSQGVAAEVAATRLWDPGELLNAATNSSGPALILVCEEIQDPGNLGSLMRSAEAAGVGGVFVTEHRSAPLSGAVAKASAGAVQHVRTATAGNVGNLIGRLKEAGVWTIGLQGSATQDLYDLDLTSPTAIVVGSEGKGLRRLTAERVDTVARIPMAGVIESLNASVAGAIALFEARRQRRQVDSPEDESPRRGRT